MSEKARAEWDRQKQILRDFDIEGVEEVVQRRRGGEAGWWGGW